MGQCPSDVNQGKLSLYRKQEVRAEEVVQGFLFFAEVDSPCQKNQDFGWSYDEEYGVNPEKSLFGVEHSLFPIAYVVKMGIEDYEPA